MKRYIHLLLHNELKFNSRIVSLINDPENKFKSNEHLFITPYLKVYEALKCYSNVEYDDTFTSGNEDLLVRYDYEYINKYGELCNWLFIHRICSLKNGLKIKKNILPKIIWRTWGGDVGYYRYRKGEPIKNLIKKYYNALWGKRIRKFKAIGIANIVDLLDLKKKFNVNTEKLYRLPYLLKENIYTLKITDIIKSDKTINILVGHSGYSNDNHLEIIDKLKCFSEKSMRVFFILSYGELAYIKQVKTAAVAKLGDKAIFIEKFMPYDEYVNFLAKMDVAIFDGKDSYALGNISVLLFLKKKFFLNHDSIIREAFDFEKLPYLLTSDIDSMSFEEFSKNISYDNKNSSMLPITYEDGIVLWKKLLDFLG